MKQTKKPLYADSLITVTDEALVFRCYYFPFGARQIGLSSIGKVEALEPSLLNGKWRIHGTGDFRTWFTRDKKRPKRDCIFILHLRGKWRRIGFTAENSKSVKEVFEACDIPVIYTTETGSSI